MRHWRIFLLTVTGAIVFTLLGSAQNAAASAAPKKIDFPRKGSIISLIVPYPPGGGMDVAARVLAPNLEAELGAHIQIVNKGGAGSQVGITYATQAKPDGYTVGMVQWPHVTGIYVDPSRQAVFGPKDLVYVALQCLDPFAVAVRMDSPYKSVKDLVEAAKRKPEGLRVSSTGINSPEQIAWLQLEELTGARFAIVQFEGGGPGVTSLLGGHIDSFMGGLAAVLGQAKGNTLRVIGTLDKSARALLPDVKDMEEQGYGEFFPTVRGWFVPKGTPSEIVEILGAAIKRVSDDKDYQKRLMDTGHIPRYMTPAEMGPYIDKMEAQLTPLMKKAMEQSRK